MEPNELENINSQNDEQENDNSQNVEQESPEQQDGETKEEFTEREKQYYARIKKLEQELKEAKGTKETPKPKTQNTGTSLKDAMALMSNNVTDDEDIEEVENYARYRKVSIAEALKDATLKSILATRQEERKTAQATSTRNTRPSVKKASGDELMQNLRKGEVPQANSTDAEELFWARRGGRR